MSNVAKFGTENLETVINLNEGMSDYFTYRKKNLNRDMTGCERLSYEYEPDVFELNEESEYTLDALAELGIDAEEIEMVQYDDEDNYEGGILL